MGIYIPNMEMPSCCNDCPCEHDGWCQAVRIKDEDFGDWVNPDVTSKYQTERSDYCPLIEVPAHGRLIDANELYERAKLRSERFTGCFDELDNVISALYIETFPTIIPAEKGGPDVE